MDRVQALHFEPGQPVLTKFSQSGNAVYRARKTILLAEDDSDLRFIMEYTLTSMGYLVIAAADAYLASAAFRTQRVDLLLSDYEMPGRTGVELARELTGLQPDLPVMIITGSILHAVTLAEINAKAWTYLSKPCHMGALEGRLQQLFTPEINFTSNKVAV